MKKENPKKIVDEESPESIVHHGRDSEVFDHQYAEYISGLKPPYSRLGSPIKRGKANQASEGDKTFDGD